MTIEPVSAPVPKPDTPNRDWLNVVRGFCMGAADTVPGVSGGTVALILGHYQRLINAISRVDTTFVGLLLQRRVRDAFDRVDGRFMVALGGGVALGIVSLAGLMHYALDHHLSITLALFLGLVVASVWVVRREVERWTGSRIAACAAGIAIAVGVTMLSPQQASMNLLYLFVCASVAICAMILPGISGAFILLLLGIYHPVTGLIKDAVKGNITSTSALQIIVFTSGCVFGLLAFSRVLRHLLNHHRDATMAALVGLMIGSVGKLWPYQLATPETAELEFKLREFGYASPAAFGSANTGIIIAFVVGVAAVVVADRIATSEPGT